MFARKASIIIVYIEGSVTPRFDVRDSESIWIRGGFLDSSGFVVDSGRFPNNIHATYNEIHRNINVFYVDSWILIRNPEWIPTCSVRDSSRDGPLGLYFPFESLSLRSSLSQLPTNSVKTDKTKWTKSSIQR